MAKTSKPRANGKSNARAPKARRVAEPQWWWPPWAPAPDEPRAWGRYTKRETLDVARPLLCTHGDEPDVLVGGVIDPTLGNLHTILGIAHDIATQLMHTERDVSYEHLRRIIRAIAPMNKAALKAAAGAVSKGLPEEYAAPDKLATFGRKLKSAWFQYLYDYWRLEIGRLVGQKSGTRLERSIAAGNHQTEVCSILHTAQFDGFRLELLERPKIERDTDALYAGLRWLHESIPPPDAAAARARLAERFAIETLKTLGLGPKRARDIVSAADSVRTRRTSRDDRLSYAHFDDVHEITAAPQCPECRGRLVDAVPQDVKRRRGVGLRCAQGHEWRLPYEDPHRDGVETGAWVSPE